MRTGAAVAPLAFEPLVSRERYGSQQETVVEKIERTFFAGAGCFLVLAPHY